MPRLAITPVLGDESDEEMVDAKVGGADEEEEEQEESQAEGGDEQENEDDDEEADEEDIYTVETILEHKFEGKKLFFLIRWEGYPEEKDFTWEPEDSCQGAPEAIKTYFESIGGRPEPALKAASRGRKSLGATPSTTVGSTAARKSAAKPSQKGKEDISTPKQDKWKPPSGSWEEDIRCIDNLEKNGAKGELMCYVHWNNGRKTQHPAHVVYKQCPQKMLEFYEKHLVFREGGVET